MTIKVDYVMFYDAHFIGGYNKTALPGEQRHKTTSFEIKMMSVAIYLFIIYLFVRSLYTVPLYVL